MILRVWCALALLGTAACGELVVDLGGKRSEDAGRDAALAHDAASVDGQVDAAHGGDAAPLADAAPEAGRDAAPEAGSDDDAGGDAAIPGPDPVMKGRIEKIFVGYQASCARLDDRRVACWGRNDSAQLALPARASTTCSACEPQPVEVSALQGALQIALGRSHGCAIVAGEVRCWGSNTFGELGIGSSDLFVHEVPAKVALANVVELAAGNGYTCARDNVGAVYCWGLGQRAQLAIDSATLSTCQAPADRLEDAGIEGRARAVPCARTPVLASTLASTKRIAAAPFHACAIDTSDVLRCWGANSRGELGLGMQSVQELPTQVLTGVQDVALGTSHSCVSQNGAVSCWGLTLFGQLGVSPVPSIVSTPTSAPMAGTVLALAAGDAHTCVIDSTQLVRCTGANDGEQLGVVGPNSCNVNGLTTECARTFVATNLPGGVEQIALGTSHGCLIVNDSVRCWGDNTYGTLGVPGPSTSLSALTAIAP